MNHFIEVKEIEISESQKLSSIEIYPESGFWLVKTKHRSDLRFVDKEEGLNLLICPESVYKAMGADTPVLPKQEEITNLSTFYNIAPGYVSEEFVLGFTKLLLNGKK